MDFHEEFIRALTFNYNFHSVTTVLRLQWSRADLVVHALAAVGDDAEKAESLGQVLSGLSLAGAGWSGRCSSKLHRQSLGQGEVDSISQRSNDQSTVQAHVLVAVPELTRTLTDQQLVSVLVPVEPQLTLPLELTSVKNTVRNKTM